MKQFILLFLLVSTLLISCENNIEEIENQDIENCNPNISFSTTIKPIIDNNCVQCHHGNRFPDLRTYQSISENTVVIKSETESRRMPIGNSLSQTEIDAILCWIESGAINN